MRVLVTGGRTYSDYNRVAKELSALFSSFPSKEDVLIHGGAPGADSLADAWAAENEVDVLVFPAQWERFGKKAGLIRNQEMLNNSQPNIVLAFPGGKGTADMVARAAAAGIQVINVID